LKTKKAQISVQVLASIAVATFMLLVVSTYAANQRLLETSQTSPVPLALGHAKADIDSDNCALFCDAGLCVNSTHSQEASLQFRLNFHPGLFPNMNNFSQSYSSFFNSSRSSLLTSGLASSLSSQYLLLSENSSDSNFSIRQTGNLSLSFNSSVATAYSLYLDCANTTDITWVPDLDSGQAVNVTFSVPGYSLLGSSLNRSRNYSASFNTACDWVNISFITGNIYANFSYMNLSLNVTAPATGLVGVFPLANKTAINASGTTFASICAFVTEPSYTANISNRRYGSFSISGQLVNIILANRSGSFNTAYIDTDGNCNFTDFEDEYFVSPGEWVRLGQNVAKLAAMDLTGANVTFNFASAGVELSLLKARLVQPIYLNK